MSPLNIHPEEDRAAKKKKDNKVLKVLLGISALIAVPVIGTTLAANIQINSDEAVQFGQGSITTAACDSGLNIAATSSYSTNFKVKTITISDIDLTSGCEGKTLTVSVATTASPSVEGELLTGVTQIRFTIPSTAGSTITTVTNLTSGVTATAGLVNSAGTAYSNDVAYNNTGAITLTITTPVLLTSEVSKFLIQSS